METKDYITVGIAILGWSWAVAQFILTRRNQKKDKALEKRFEVYSSFMDKVDEINQGMRNDPQMIYGLSSDLMAAALSDDENDLNVALIDYNSTLLEIIKKSTQPLMIINQELNKLKLICSDKMLPKIEEYKRLTNDYNEEIQLVLSQVSGRNDISYTAKEFEKVVTHNERIQKITQLRQEVEAMMRNEIGYYKD